MTTLTQSISIQPENIINKLKQFDPKANYQIDKLIYYPYHFFKYKMKAKGLLKLDGYLGCTIDSISGQGAIIDHTPLFMEENLHDQPCLPSTLSLQDAKIMAEDFLNHSASLKLKFFSIPKMQLEQHERFFRPYWIIVNQKNNEKYPSIMIDGVSGKYHPLNI
ncbi:hypothetical protein ACJROX_27635 [Pseudalkalibacillus sp. A8]|uniref:hypothetical protein n=1 Tax=Pseudalkalibacillus sp. A8 TaxID=3382641 RepID=UPI0038B4DA83